MKNIYVILRIALISIASLVTDNLWAEQLDHPDKDILDTDIQKTRNELAIYPDSLPLLSKLCSYSTVIGDYEAALAYADRLLEVTAEDSLSYDRLTALAYSGQACLAADRYDQAWDNIQKGISLWNRFGSDASYIGDRKTTPVSILYNNIGVYYTSRELDYETATDFFIQGLSFARDHSGSTDYAVLSFNLIMTFFMRGDAEGLKYADEIYQIGKQSENKRLIYMGAFESAMMNYLKKDYQNAETCIREALKSPVKIDSVWVNNVYADILSAQDRNQDASEYYLRAYRYVDEISSTTASFVCLSYGNYLLKVSRIDDAIDVFQKGLEIANSSRNKIFTYQLYQNLSIAHARRSEYRKALSYYQMYHQLSDSIFNIKKEKTIRELTIQYKTARHEAELKEKDMLLMKNNHILTLVLLFALLVLAGSLVIFLRYKHKNQMYTKIVRQHQDALRREKHLEDIIHTYKDKEINQFSPDQPDQIDPNKSEQIISRLEELMEKKKAYKDNTLSRDKLAELVGTNRTYLSKIINEQFGKSVNRYINSYRINHAIELLSNLKEDLPMKAIESESGFNSSSSFFKLFKEEVGMSPANFRKKILELSKAQNTEL